MAGNDLASTAWASLMRRQRMILATGSDIFAADVPADGEDQATMTQITPEMDLRPTCLATYPGVSHRVWCGTRRHGLLRSDDGGISWSRSGLGERHVTAVAVHPQDPDLVWVGTEPSAVFRSTDGGGRWDAMEGLLDLPSSSEWAFPPRPETHHVRWIALHPLDPEHVWIAIEAGALIRSRDGGASWEDRVRGGPVDSHEIALHPERPEALRVAAGDGWFESEDGGDTWTSPTEGLEVGYLRSVAIDPGDPDVVLVSAASRPRTAYMSGHSDGRVYRKSGDAAWERVVSGWPRTPDTIAPLLHAGRKHGELWAADERGLHASADGGRSWRCRAVYPSPPSNLRGLALLDEAVPRP